ncbi:MAG: single-stranded DNA-binding protein [Erysipelotrichaceae bacterium]|nr:single-stranded DNA-binding protein [Erysipelotrichaceae bacterium]
MFKIILSGRITKDAEVKVVNDAKVCNFTIATSNNNKKNDTFYLKCSVWNRMAEVMEQHVKKGKQLFILGTGSINHYKDNEENVHDVLNIHCDIIEFGSDARITASDFENDVYIENDY